MRILFTAALLAGILAGCTNNNEGSNASADIENADSIATETESPDARGAAALAARFPGYLGFLKAEDSAFQAASFEQGAQDSLPVLPYYPIGEEEKYSKLKHLLIFNADSSLALDLFLYNAEVLPGDTGKGYKLPEGPDTEVGLIDWKKKTRRRVLFLGSAGAVVDGAWVAPDRFVLAGAETIDTDQLKPVLWQVNLADSSIQTIFYPDTLRARLHAYKNPQLQQQRPLRETPVEENRN
ncbi:MAG TPA: hypothetical protein VHK69_07185 [Chitinophagaceae bacterium]|jgi:hypothetical protein|nr:hypothetical protein [Chitinophagaceae bacterium]